MTFFEGMLVGFQGGEQQNLRAGTLVREGIPCCGYAPNFLWPYSGANPADAPLLG
jgi:hypothetical protein